MSKLSVSRGGTFVKLWVTTSLPYSDDKKDGNLVRAFSAEFDNIQEAELWKRYLIKYLKIKQKGV